MIPVLSRDQIRAFDRHAIDRCGVPSLELMENAGRGAAERIEALLAGPSRVVVLCGAGNNGGDGFVVARRLLSRGHSARVLLTAPAGKLKGDALTNYRAFIGVGGTVDAITGPADHDRIDAALGEADLAVDALFGTGLDREIQGRLRDVVERLNTASVRRVSLDIPSGIDADRGAVLGVAVRADETVTFAHLKLGLVTSRGAEHAGRVTVADIGVPAGLCRQTGTSARVLEEGDVARLLHPRPLATHKGSAGRVVVLAGSSGKTGAALLVARGALRAGAGLVTICTFPDAADALDRRVLEEMTGRIDPGRIEASLDAELQGADAVVVGPGFGLDEKACAAVDHVVLRFGGPVVVDADALTHLAGRAGELRRAAGPRVLTPHPGEGGRLFGSSAREVEQDRFGALARAVDTTGAVVLLKGARTLVGAPGELPVVNPSGTPALATAGAGDVLSGILGALCCSSSPFEAAYAAAYVHGRSGERWAARTGADRGLLAREIADGVPEVMGGLTAATDHRPGEPSRT